MVDVVGVLTDQPTPRGASTYWAVLKKRLKEEGADQLLTNCKQLKMTAADGKKRLTDVAGTERPRGLKENRGVSRPPKCDRQKHAPRVWLFPQSVVNVHTKTGRQKTRLSEQLFPKTRLFIVHRVLPHKHKSDALPFDRASQTFESRTFVSRVSGSEQHL